ncbi:ribosome-associated ATPase/putative transporter RbbA [Nitrobacter vulgaris]|uniref:Multidrug ABC transporter ATP-binding protein n=1 Tax=Nitrobacter vulgaris TaxID=29421 RepID=A0A1V4HTR7_NITVU|nr:ribosome-associated ATPase/putative transporter RbbA [Nitrobacter vulgaris]OPH81357.1 multidrug ABC transporter ATP-binding protein [Nitrobacter vulgaris]
MSDEAACVARLAAVTHKYAATKALDAVSIDIPAGRMVGLIGPDGVGKSTLLALVAGVRKIQSGNVHVLGGDMAAHRHRADVCARIAYMPQGLGRNLYPTLSVVENVDFFGRLFGQSATEREWRIADLLRSTGLDPFADRPAGKLSGGMKQKLSLCCSLIHDPDLLILDEPTTGVDPLSRKQFWELIERIHARRPTMSVIVATAYMEEAERFNHLIAMDAGQILAIGTADELKRQAQRDTLEEAFIGLLPEAKRANHRAVVLPPRVAAQGPPAIEAEDLTMRFGDFTAVDHVTARIERGEIFGFLGSNGCGKTTTMKMLTGLLPPTEGTAKLFGHEVDPNDIETRRRVGYMSQSFSLYSELSVRQNLDLHASLFDLPADQSTERVDEMIGRFELSEVAGELPESMPLGVRQRLQLAVAVLHKPEMLILDEPTSGVDPIARDRFWELLIQLSRDDGVTIFISTHFVNEAERCDRISLMHAGKILAMDTPDELRRTRGAQTLEDAFIGYLEDAVAADAPPVAASAADEPQSAPRSTSAKSSRWFDPSRVWAFAQREAVELVRDPIRIVFALLGPIVLAIAMANGISFDVEKLTYAALDRDRSQESQSFLDYFSGSRYFEQRGRLASQAELDEQMLRGQIKFGLEIPPKFGKDLLSGRAPEVGVWFDGANTFQAESARGYVQGVLSNYLSEFSRRETGRTPLLYPADIETRLRYNQAFLSVNAISPGVLMLLMYMFSTMLTALGVVREKELGSIMNLYAAPATKIEFLVGKQLPYIGVALISFLSLYILTTVLFGVSVSGNVAALALGALLFATAATSLGLVISSFVSTQLAAIFASAIIVMIPSLNFSGMLYPVSTLEGGARIVGHAFPALYFQKITSGVFNKGLGFANLYPDYWWLLVFCMAFWILATLLLRKQEV